MKQPLYPLKFIPIFKDRIWGGKKLKEVFEKEISNDSVGESWELSGVEEDVSVVENGELAGKTLTELINTYSDELIGKLVSKKTGNTFPILIKFIDAKKDLSIQVHPNDQIAKKRHRSLGKTEMWHVLHADEGAQLIVGFKEGVSKETYRQKLQEKKLQDILKYENVKKGDTFFIDSGVVHAIGGGILLAEIQQTSDITYRIYDFDRADKNGNKRELHTELAIDVLKYEKDTRHQIDYNKHDNQSNKMVDSPYFITNYLPLKENIKIDLKHRDSFSIYICVEGSGTIENDFGSEDFFAGETILLGANNTFVHFTTKNATLLEVHL